MILGTSEGKDELPHVGLRIRGQRLNIGALLTLQLTTLKGCLALNRRTAGIPVPCWSDVSRHFEDLLSPRVGSKAFFLVYLGPRKVGTFLLCVDLCVAGIKRLIDTTVTSDYRVTSLSVCCHMGDFYRAPPSLIILTINGNNNSC